MKRPTPYILLAVLIVVMAIAAAAIRPWTHRDARTIAETGTIDTSTVRGQIRDVQTRFQDAVRRKDMEAVTALMTPDFTQKSSDGKVMDLKQARNAMRETWPSIKSFDEWTLNLVELKVSKDKAVGFVKEHVRATLVDPSGRTTPYTVDSTSRNTWVRTAGGWKYRHMEELKQDTGGFENLEIENAPKPTQDTNGSGLVAYDEPSRAASGSARRPAAQPAGPSGPLSEAQARRLLQRLYADYQAAVRRKDADAILGTMTENYAVTYPDRIEERWAVEKSVAAELKQTVSIPEWTLTIHEVRVSGDTITTVVDDKRTSIYKEPNGKRHRGRIEVRMRDVWVQTDAGWKNQSTELISSRISMDGKPAR